MDSRFIICVKGISGSGKSTRTYLLLKFLREVLGCESEEFFVTNPEGKQKLAGIFVKDFDLIFIGKEYTSGAVTRFQGYDAVTSVFGSSAGFSEFLKANSAKYSFIVEGAGTTQTNRLRPKFLHEFCGFTDIMMQYYNYGGIENKQEYLNRIIYRSGKCPEKAMMWDKEESFTKEVTFTHKEIKELGDKAFVTVFHNLYDAEPDDLGKKFFGLFTDLKVAKQYTEFVKNSDYIKLNSFENFKK